MNHLKLNVFCKSIWLFFLFGTLPTTKLLRVHPRIIGGEECIYEKIPYIIQILIEIDEEIYKCVGSLISLEWILTAAHCIDQDSILSNSTFATSGFHYSAPQIRVVKKGIPYGKYDDNDENEPRYDIGLMLVYRPFDETSVVKSGTLPRRGFSQGCTEVIAAGTGATEIHANYTPKQTPSPHPDPFNNTLFCVDLEIITRKLCQKGIEPLELETAPNLDDSIICTVSRKDKKGTCNGDSGGPLSCRGVIIGVNSAVIRCGKQDLPSIAQSVESYLDFIAEITNITTQNSGIERGHILHTTTKISSYLEKGNSNKRVVVRNLLITGIFITLWI